MGKKVATDAPVNKPSDYCKYEGHEVWWSADPKGKAILQHAETGLASIDPKKGVPFMTIPQLFQKAVKRYPKQVALRSEQMGPLAKGQTAPPPTPLSEWKSWSWRQYYDDSCAAAKAFISLGLEPHDSVNIFGFNSPEWLMSQMGAMLAGGKAAGIYPTDTPDQVQFKSDHSNGAIACLENEGCLEKFKQVANQLPWLKCIVTWACEPGDDIKTADGRTIKTISWEEMIKLGKSLPDEPLNERIKNQDPGHACALIYTSGTTGNPKAVMITHDNMIYTACAAMLLPGVMGVKEGEERIISYLPLSHVAGMMIDVISPIIVTSGVAGFKGWHNTNFARPYDLKIGTLVDRLQTIRPTIFLGVPRVWEKIMEKMKSVGASSKGLKKALADYSKKRAAVYTSSRQLGGTGTTPNMLLANLVLGAVKKKLGLNKCKFYFSGAAPMTQECLEYFGALNFNINEVYGMSESTGGATWSTDKHHVWGAVGHEYTGVEVRVFKKAEDGGDDFSNVVECPPAENLFASTEEQQGEICFRGRIIMLGYMANPRLGKEHVDEIEQKNRDAIDKNGFMHSGDKGTRDIHGMIKITGRYKELIIGAGGENIAPVPIEDEIKRVCPLISNVMMIGNKRKYNVCILTLKAVGASGELPGSDKLAPPASTFSPKSKTISEAMNDESIIKAITQAITDVNKNEKVVPSNAAKIQKFTILPRDFSVVTGELTATLKLKRAVAESEFTPIIDKMYQSKDDYVNYNLAPTPGLDMGTPKEGAVVEEERPEKDLSFNMIKEVEDAGAVLEAGGQDAKLDE